MCKRLKFGIIKFILTFFGCKIYARSQMTEEERAIHKNKAREFRSRLRAAFEVWDDAEEVYCEPVEHTTD